MAFESDDDRLSMLSDFGVDITIGAATITGIFDNQYIDDNGMVCTDPLITVRSSDVVGVTKGTAVTVLGIAYTTVIPEDDGQGITRIPLRRT